MPFDIDATSRSTLIERFGGAALIVLTGCCAALVANVAIDIAGDWLLPHDTYDDIAHGSRSFILIGALGAVVAAALRLIFATLDAKQPQLSAGAPGGVLPPQLPHFIAFVIATAFVILAGMQWIDLTIAGQTPDTLVDLFGGSYWLAAVITLPTALCAAVGTWRTIRWLTAAGVAVIGLIAAWFITRALRADASCRLTRRLPRRFALSPVRARSASKRGPPFARR